VISRRQLHEVQSVFQLAAREKFVGHEAVPYEKELQDRNRLFANTNIEELKDQGRSGTSTARQSSLRIWNLEFGIWNL